MTPTPNVVNLYHSGDLGDVVYAIPALRRLANPAHLTLYPNPGVTRQVMDEANAGMILPLLNAQHGVSGDWKPGYGAEGLRIDFAVRRFYRNGYNLADIHSNWVGHDHWDRCLPWLTAAPRKHKYRIAVSRSARYRNSSFDWSGLYKQFEGRAVFVGGDWEYENFCQEIGHIDYIPTPSLLEAAQVMMGCDLFIGNQSCPRAIAEGLKMPVVVEQADPVNTHFDRPYAHYPSFGHTYPDITADGLIGLWCATAASRAKTYSVHPAEHLHELARVAHAARWADGDLVEIGVGNGGSLSVLAWCMQRKIVGYDTLSDLIEEQHPQYVTHLGDLLRVYPTEFVWKAFDPSKHDKIALAHIDLGTLRGMAETIKAVLPKLAVGGYAAISGYGVKDLEMIHMPTIGWTDVSPKLCVYGRKK